MKTYIKPIAEVKTFSVTTNIAALEDFLAAGGNDVGLSSDVITAANITTYTMTSTM